MFDLDAVENETEGIPFEFSFGGEKYELPPRVDFFAAAAFAQGDRITGVHRLLGDEQWERMVASDAVFDEPKLLALLEEYRKHLGVSLGESDASTSS